MDSIGRSCQVLSVAVELADRLGRQIETYGSEGWGVRIRTAQPPITAVAHIHPGPISPGGARWNEQKKGGSVFPGNIRLWSFARPDSLCARRIAPAQPTSARTKQVRKPSTFTSIRSFGQRDTAKSQPHGVRQVKSTPLIKLPDSIEPLFDSGPITGTCSTSEHVFSARRSL
jgi:hypothetical protein